jgi:hypothetical protein
VIVFCEECGHRYIIEQEIDLIKGLAFRCEECEEMVRVAPNRAQSIDKVAK